MEVAAEAPIDTGSDGDAAAQQATTKALSKFLSYDELKAHLAVNYAGLEASLLPNTTGSLLFAQKEAGEPIEDLFDSVARRRIYIMLPTYRASDDTSSVQGIRHRFRVCRYRFRASARPPFRVCRYMPTPLEGDPIIPGGANTQILRATRFHRFANESVLRARISSTHEV